MAAVRDNKAQNRFELDVEGAVAFANYRITPSAVVITFNGQAVSGNYFKTLGVRAAIGRLLTSEDDPQLVSVISYGLWLRRFISRFGTTTQF